jgi:hypothetical protein
MKSSLRSLIPFLPLMLNHLQLPSQGTPSILILSWVEFYVKTDGQLASLSWYKAPIWGLRPDLYYSYDNYGVFFLWGALSDERMGLTFIYAAGPCQRNLSLVRAPWFLFYSLRADPTENTVSTVTAQQYFNCCLFIRCYRNLFTESLPSNECLIWLH